MVFPSRASFFEITTSSATRRKAVGGFGPGTLVKSTDVSAEGMGDFHPICPNPQGRKMGRPLFQFPTFQVAHRANYVV